MQLHQAMSLNRHELLLEQHQLIIIMVILQHGKQQFLVLYSTIQVLIVLWRIARTFWISLIRFLLYQPSKVYPSHQSKKHQQINRSTLLIMSLFARPISPLFWLTNLQQMMNLQAHTELCSKDLILWYSRSCTHRRPREPTILYPYSFLLLLY